MFTGTKFCINYQAKNDSNLLRTHIGTLKSGSDSNIWYYFLCRTIIRSLDLLIFLLWYVRFTHSRYLAWHRFSQMISIKPSCVPEYLKDSAFFGNLGEDDEEVSVPKDCCKLDTSVTNAAELEELLRALRFWGVDRIPTTVVRFVISNDRTMWESVTANYVADLPLLAGIVQVVKCKREKQVCEAASLGYLDVVTCLLEHGCPVEHGFTIVSATCNIAIKRAVDIAAGNGDLEIVQVLRQHNCEFTEDTGRAAAQGGHFICLEYLMQNGCPVAENLICWALRSGKVEIIQYLHDMGLPWPESMLRPLLIDVEENKEALMVCITYAYKLGCPYDGDTCYFASMYGWYDILVDAHQNGCKIDKYCTHRAAGNGHLACLTYLHEHGCPWEEIYTASYALENNHIDCFKYAVEHGCPAPPRTFSSAVLSGSVETVQYLRDRGIPWPRNILSAFGNKSRAVMDSKIVDNVELCLKFANRLGCPYDPQTCYFASMYGWYDILVDAHEHGCALNQLCTQNAIVNGHHTCLEYLEDNGFLLDGNGAINMID